MKQKLKLIITVSATSVLVFSVMAEDTSNKLTNASDRSLTNNADNTVRNVRDRDNQNVTPFDQGNSKSDISTTAQIRKAIIAEKQLSVNARNVKIVTNGGKVTLRGPVNTAEEKRLIGEIANRIASIGNVDNQLEVKHTTSSN